MIITQQEEEEVRYYPSNMLNAQFMQYAPRVAYCVYVLKLHGGRYKVGMSKNLHQRVRDYTTIQPDLELIAAFFLEDKHDAERLEVEMLSHWDKFRIGTSEVLELDLSAASLFYKYLENIETRYTPARHVRSHKELKGI